MDNPVNNLIESCRPAKHFDTARAVSGNEIAGLVRSSTDQIFK
jgi:hypothetical protein